MNMDRCPHCKARIKEQPICRRCGADLSPLLLIETQAGEYARRCVQSLLAGNMQEAEDCIAAAVLLHATDCNRVLQGFVQSLGKNAL